MFYNNITYYTTDKKSTYDVSMSTGGNLVHIWASGTVRRVTWPENHAVPLFEKLFHVNYNKHSTGNQLTKSYKSVNDEHIQSPGPQAAKSCNLNSSAPRSKYKITDEKNFSFPDFPDFFHFPGLFPDQSGIPWLFQVFQVSGHPDRWVCAHVYISTYRVSTDRVS